MMALWEEGTRETTKDSHVQLTHTPPTTHCIRTAHTHHIHTSHIHTTHTPHTYNSHTLSWLRWVTY